LAGGAVFDNQIAHGLSVEAGGCAHPVAEINAYEAIGFDEFMCMSIAVTGRREPPFARDPTVSQMSTPQVQTVDVRPAGAIA
jgi:hypothetical protein